MAFREQARRGDRARHLPTLVWSLVVAVLLLLPGDEFPDAGGWEWTDKPLHALLFAVECVLLARSLRALRPRSRYPAAAAAVAGLYAAVLELAQHWVPGRSWDRWDLAAGLLGAGVAALVLARRRARLSFPS